MRYLSYIRGGCYVCIIGYDLWGKMRTKEIIIITHSTYPHQSY